MPDGYKADVLWDLVRQYGQGQYWTGWRDGGESVQEHLRPKIHGFDASGKIPTTCCEKHRQEQIAYVEQHQPKPDTWGY